MNKFVTIRIYENGLRRDIRDQLNALYETVPEAKHSFVHLIGSDHIISVFCITDEQHIDPRVKSESFERMLASVNYDDLDGKPAHERLVQHVERTNQILFQASLTHPESN